MVPKLMQNFILIPCQPHNREHNSLLKNWHVDRLFYWPGIYSDIWHCILDYAKIHLSNFTATEQSTRITYLSDDISSNVITMEICATVKISYHMVIKSNYASCYKWICFLTFEAPKESIIRKFLANNSPCFQCITTTRHCLQGIFFSKGSQKNFAGQLEYFLRGISK